LFVLVLAIVAGGLAQPAQASDDGPPQYRYLPTLSTPRSALAQPAVLDEPAPLAEPKLFQVFLPLTLASPQAVLDEVDLVDFTYRLQEGDDLAMLALVWGVDSELMACVTRSGQEALSGLRPGTVIMIANPRYRCHTVQLDETPEQIAQNYGVEVDVLLAEPWNLLESAGETLEPGRRLLILDGVRPDLASLRASEAAFGVTIPETAAKLRLLAKHGETLQSHYLHVLFLAAARGLGFDDEEVRERLEIFGGFEGLR
jgi:hypothetical protein